jgi:hypothetical protein
VGEDLRKIKTAQETIARDLTAIKESLTSIADSLKRLADLLCGSTAVGVEIKPGQPTEHPSPVSP